MLSTSTLMIFKTNKECKLNFSQQRLSQITGSFSKKIDILETNYKNN